MTAWPRFDMHPHVTLKLQDGRLVLLRPGDIIGRSDRAALCLSEPHVSEAHAMVSLRAGQLKLLGLRGRFSVNGKPTAQATLEPGQRIVLASRTPLLVEEVVLPTEALALEADGFGPQLLGPVCSLRVSPTLELTAGFVPEADAIFWTSGDQLFARVGAEATRPLGAGDELVVLGQRVRIRATSVEVATHAATEQSDELGAPLHLIMNYDTVHIIGGTHRLTLDGIAARIVSELAAVRVPIAWQEVARLVWGRDTMAENALRERWDSSLARLRRRLKEARIRTDLVYATGAGHVELLLGPGDTMEDRM